MTDCSKEENIIEQDKDEKLKQLIQQLINGEASKPISQKYMVVNDILYYLSNHDREPTPCLYVPDHLQERVILQYHEHIGHMGIDKTYDALRENIFGQISINNFTAIFLNALHVNKEL